MNNLPAGAWVVAAITISAGDPGGAERSPYGTYTQTHMIHSRRHYQLLSNLPAAAWVVAAARSQQAIGAYLGGADRSPYRTYTAIQIIQSRRHYGHLSNVPAVVWAVATSTISAGDHGVAQRSPYRTYAAICLAAR